MKNQKTMGNKGFSLVELIVVIAIMAVLVGVLAPQFIKYVEKSRESTDIQNMEECKTALVTYYADQPMTGSITLKFKDDAAVAGDTNAMTDAGMQNTKLKSAKWTGGTDCDVSWTYNFDNNTWTSAGHADYFNADGSKYVAP